jgi:periplasmic divalent cation tolerance protein
MMDKMVVLATCGSEGEAQRIARGLVEARLAACVNVLAAPVRSIYRWKGKVEEAEERLLVIKTTRGRFRALQREIQRLHSYDAPEIIALPIAAGARAYLDWLAHSVTGAAKTRPATSRKGR